MWILIKFNTAGTTFYGEPNDYVLYNNHGYFMFYQNVWHNITNLIYDAPYDFNKPFFSNTHKVSKLEALIMFGLHDGNAEDIK